MYYVDLKNPVIRRTEAGLLRKSFSLDKQRVRADLFLRKLKKQSLPSVRPLRLVGETRTPQPPALRFDSYKG
jgi:hypothetical protein